MRPGWFVLAGRLDTLVRVTEERWHYWFTGFALWQWGVGIIWRTRKKEEQMPDNKEKGYNVEATDLERAMDEATRRMFLDGDMIAASESAGFLKTIGGQQFQVFVKVCRYSDELLASDPDSGGLLCEATPPTKKEGGTT